MKKYLNLLLAAVLVISLMFAGISCKEEAATETAAEETAPAEEEEVAEEAVAEEVVEEEPEIGGTLKFLGWEGYDGLKVLEPWLEENNIVVESTYIGNEEEVFTKLMTMGPEAFDILGVYSGFTDRYVEMDLLEEIDKSRIPNFENLIGYLKENPSATVDGKLYGVTFTWSPVSNAYNADEMEPVESWAELADPEYKGKIVMLSNPHSIFVQSAKVLGLGNPYPSWLTEEELAEAVEFAKKIIDNAVTIVPTYGEMKSVLVGVDAVTTFTAWSAIAGWCQAEGTNIKLNWPKEGSISYLDIYAITKGAKNADTAYAFINKMLEPEIQAAFATEMSAFIAVADAVPFLTEDALKVLPEDLDLSDFDAIFELAPAIPPTPSESDEFTTVDDWVEAWEEILASM